MRIAIDVVYGNVDFGLEQLENATGMGKFKVVSSGHGRLQGCLSFFRTDALLKDFFEKHYTEWEWKDTGLGKIQYLRLDEFGFSDRISKYWNRDDVPLADKFPYNFQPDVPSAQQLDPNIETGEQCFWTEGSVGCFRIVHNNQGHKLHKAHNRM